MNHTSKRRLGALLSALITLSSATLTGYLRTPPQIQIAFFGVIAAAAAYWQVEVKPPKD